MGEPGESLRARVARKRGKWIVAKESSGIWLKGRPGLRSSEIAQATGSVVVTVQDRLRRLKRRGEVQSGARGGWSAASV